MRLAGVNCLIALAVGLTWSAGQAFAGGRYLDALRNEVDEAAVTTPPDTPADNGHSTPRSGRNGRSSDNGASDFCQPADDVTNSMTQAMFWAVLMGLSLPWVGPHVLLEEDGVGTARFPVGPYAEGSDGYLLFDDEGPATKPWSGRVSLDTAYNFDDVSTLTGRLRLDTTYRVGIDAEWASLIERGPGTTDWLGRGDCNVVVRFAQSPRLQMHSGIGINWLADHDQADVGFNFTYGADFFPIDPVVSSATLDLGKIGDSSLIHFRGTIGVMVRPHLHVYTGYDLLNLEGNSIHSLLTGVEFWF